MTIVYLAGSLRTERADFHRLDTFYEIFNGKRVEQPHRFKSFLLDSGAFSVLNQQKRDVDWASYVDAYSDWIIANKIKLFVEMDIDKIIGLPAVEKLRERLERRTGAQSIPVWHVHRGKDYWLRLIREYSYIAYGSFITDNVPLERTKRFLPWFNGTAAEQNCRVHGLGYTPVNLEDLWASGFYSVDSSSVTCGVRFGYVNQFTGTRMNNIKKPDGCRLNSQKGREHNINEWIKYTKAAEQRGSFYSRLRRDDAPGKSRIGVKGAR